MDRGAHDLDLSGDEQRDRHLLVVLAGSARRAGRQAVTSGRWLADTVIELAPRVPVRNAATLRAQYDGLDGAELATVLVRSAGRVSAGFAATTGGVIAAQQLSIVGVLIVPFELAALTALVTLVELKLVAELHQVAGRPLPGGPADRTAAAVMSWMSGSAHADDPAAPGRRVPLGRAGRQRLRRELRTRFTRNLSAIGPLLTGAAAAGFLNRRSTRDLGRRVARDLGLRR